MKHIQLIFILLLILAVLTRIFLSFIFSAHLKEGQYVHFTTTLLTEPTNHGNFDTMTVQYSNGFSSVPLSLAFPSGNMVHYGDVVDISGKVKFKVLKNGQPITTISSLKFTIDSTKKNIILDSSFFLRNQIQTFYEKVFSPQTAALLLGIVLGIKGNFPKYFLQDLQTTGVMHVIAASGMNVTMVSGFLLGVFGMLFRRQWAIALTIAGLLFYCVISGLQASILRATIMILFALSAQLFGRQYTGLYGLFLAAAGMILYNPTWIFDIGFQLSFAATLGIFFLKPLLPAWKILSDDIGTTITAQIATLPILIGSFGSYGLFSIVVNALVLWTIPPLMVFGGVGGFLGLVFEPIGRLLLIFCLPFLWIFQEVILFFGSLHWQLTLTEVPLPMTVGYYLVLGSMVWISKRKRDI